MALMVVYFYSLTPPELFVLEEISPERRDDSRIKKIWKLGIRTGDLVDEHQFGSPSRKLRKKERKKCRFVHWPGIELRSGGLAPLVLPSGP